MPADQMHLTIEWVRPTSSSSQTISGGRGRASVSARLTHAGSGAPVGGARVQWLAAAPPERRASFEGSGLPFANEQVAMQSTPNRGHETTDEDGRFTVSQLQLPNSYYVGLGTVLVPPSLHVIVPATGASATARLPQQTAVPFRTLTYPAQRTGPMFYHDNDGLVRSQQDLLFRRGYPAPAAYFPSSSSS